MSTYRDLPITYELCFDPRDRSVLVYRSIPAGICGPFTDSAPCKSREEAEAFARVWGYELSGPWESHANYDSADLALRV